MIFFYLLVVRAYRLVYQPKQYHTKNVQSIFQLSNANSDSRFGLYAKNCVGILLTKVPVKNRLVLVFGIIFPVRITPSALLQQQLAIIQMFFC